MADRVGVINKGEIILVEEKAELMRKLGRKHLTLQLQRPLVAIPECARRLRSPPRRGRRRRCSMPTTRKAERTGITALLRDLAEAGIRFRDLETKETSLEDIFVNLVRNGR